MLGVMRRTGEKAFLRDEVRQSMSRFPCNRRVVARRRLRLLQDVRLDEQTLRVGTALFFVLQSILRLLLPCSRAVMIVVLVLLVVLVVVMVEGMVRAKGQKMSGTC